MKIVLEIELLLCIIIITLPCIKKLHPNVQVTLIDYYYYLPLSIFLVLLLPTFLHCTMYFGARSEVKWLLIHLRGPFIYYVITFLGFLRRLSDERDLRWIWEGFSVLKSKMALRSRTYTPFEMDLRRYSDWEGPPCMYWDGFEKVLFLRRFWEAWNYYRVVEMDLRFEMDLRRKYTLPTTQVILTLRHLTR